MPISPEHAHQILLADLNPEQEEAVRSDARRLLVVAGAGSGKTEVMARRLAWWVAVDEVPKDEIIAFTFTDSAAEELKFRIRYWLEKIASPGEDTRLGEMYVGTIHGFSLKTLRNLAPDEYYMFDVVDDAGRRSLIEQGYHNVLGLRSFEETSGLGKFRSIELFLRGYDLLNEYDKLDVSLPADPPPPDVSQDLEWCQSASLRTDIGESTLARQFAESAARYYAYLRARRFLDFSTIQAEMTGRLKNDARFRQRFSAKWSRLVVDEVQDINPVQYSLIQEIVADDGFLTAVGDHRQAIYSFRGGRVELMGHLYEQFESAADGHVQELPANYRSTPRIIELANRWSEKIKDTAGMANPAMEHRREARIDCSNCHVAQVHFNSREEESSWIADTIAELVHIREDNVEGAYHDDRVNSRGLMLSDVAILVRSGTDIRAYQESLRRRDIPAIVRGGPDLFSQPEVLLFLSALSLCSGLTNFLGHTNNPRSMPGRVQSALGVEPEPSKILQAAIRELRCRGLNIPDDTETRLELLCNAINRRLEAADVQPEEIAILECSSNCRHWLTRNQIPRRVFPQTIFHWLLREACIYRWGTDENKSTAETALFHVGQLSSLVKALETSGWTPVSSFRWQLIAMLNWGAGLARAAESPLLVRPDAVTVTTIHAAKGLEFGAVFVADVCARRFPSNKAKTIPRVPFDDASPGYVDPSPLADNEHNDDERRLMYVALTRAERYLFVTASGESRSRFFGEVGNMIAGVGGVVAQDGLDVGRTLSRHPSSLSREDRLATNFSDLRYFLECPHDFYLRNVLGFTPTIGQEFGYGRGLHNLLRVIHSNPRHWAEIATDRSRLREEAERLLEEGMFYLRYTVGEPLQYLQRSAIEGVIDYVESYAEELARMQFEPEKEFETLISEENLLISGTIDVLRLDDPPRVSILDFKSGDRDGDTGSGLSRQLMSLQIGVYGLAARNELEFVPQHGFVRYIGERDPARRQMEVNLDDRQLVNVRREIVQTAKKIQHREFDNGPTERVENRCDNCDFVDFCSRPEAIDVRRRTS